MILICVIFLFFSCKTEKENTNIPLVIYNNLGEDLYILLNVWLVSNINNPEIISDFTLSRNLVVNKIIISKTKIDFNNQFPHPTNTTITLTHKEPVFLEFNKSDSINLNLKIKENIKNVENYSAYIQLISFSKKDIAARKIDYLLFSKETLSLDLTESMFPFEDNEMLDSINNFGYFDSINIIPIEFKLVNGILERVN